MGDSQSKQQNKQDEPKPQNISEIVLTEKKVKEASVPHTNNTPLKQNFEDTEKEKESSGWLPLLGLCAIPFAPSAYTRVRRLISLRYMIKQKDYVTPGWALTEYRDVLELGYDKSLENVCSITGRRGIGKTQAILRWINQFSKTFPVIYISLKWTQRRNGPAFTFMRNQLKSLKFIRDHHKFSFIAYLFPLAMPFIWMPALPFLQSSWCLAMFGPEVLYGSFASLYLWGVYPILKYCWTRYIPTVIFDDLDMMALHQDPLEVQKCTQFYSLVNDKLASVIVLSSDSRTSNVIRKMPSARDVVDESIIKFDPEHTYKQILADEKVGFTNMKKTFLRGILTQNQKEKCLSNDAIKYFILQLKDRELSLRELQSFFDPRVIKYRNMFDEFKKKFQEEIEKKTFEKDELKQQKLKQIVKKVCKIYDCHQKAEMQRSMDQIMSAYDKDVEGRKKLNVLIRFLGVEAQSAEKKQFEKVYTYFQLYQLFSKYNILKQEGKFVSFQSKMKKDAFKLWFEEDGLKNLEKCELMMKKQAENKKTP